jgi:hypothetical protein
MFPGVSRFSIADTEPDSAIGRAHLQTVFKPRISVLCPALGETNTLNSQRNRPARFPDAGPFPSSRLDRLAVILRVRTVSCGSWASAGRRTPACRRQNLGG